MFAHNYKRIFLPIAIMISYALSTNIGGMEPQEVQGIVAESLLASNSLLLHETIRANVSVIQNLIHHSVRPTIQSITIQTIHGSAVITDPLIIELIMSPAMQRLKKIRQYGTIDYALKHKLIYNRFDHSLGVYYILRKHNASRIEQIAGLLHDVSHTVFSHSTDPLFMGDLTRGAYQDTIHDVFIEKYGIKEILDKYGISVKDVMPKNTNFRALGLPAPALNADRIEYNIYAAYMDDLLSPAAIQHIHNHLHFDGRDWYFDDLQAARDFALIPLHQTMYMWGGPLTILVDDWTCSALKRALVIGLINKEDISFNTNDDELWEKLKASTDPEIRSYVYKIINGNRLFSWSKERSSGITVLKAKCRAVDPLVKTPQGLLLLSQIDHEFKAELEAAQKLMQSGWTVVLHADSVAREENDDPRLHFKEIESLRKNNSAHL